MINDRPLLYRILNYLKLNIEPNITFN